MTQFRRLFASEAERAALRAPEPDPPEPTIPLSEARLLLDAAREEAYSSGQADAEAAAEARIAALKAEFDGRMQGLVENTVDEARALSARVASEAQEIVWAVLSSLLTQEGAALVRASLADHLSAVLANLVAHGTERITVRIGEADARFIAERAPEFGDFCARKGIALEILAEEDAGARVSFDGGAVDIDVHSHAAAALGAVRRRLQPVPERTT